MSLNRQFAVAFAAGLLFAAGANAAEHDTLQPATASVTDLGSGTSALTYWVDDAEGRHVVTTVDQVLASQGEEHHAVVRFSAVLLPGQSQIVSVPALDASEPAALQITRSGDHIEVTRIVAHSTARLN